MIESQPLEIWGDRFLENSDPKSSWKKPFDLKTWPILG